ncbi:bifunctional ADP-dependent NAD(P)H-hydrate dehydratase/NAD(P)H-hydrate epimerase, partial [Blautia wexlerae]|uniref:NAD(P)H-hydrate dehydratase n=1 Tax=Blautia wexlerae TaxID=418240 RepID=UPI00299F6F34
ATAGMGDVLAGMIVSFVGQGYTPKNAAILGTYLHGSCGDVIGDNSSTVLPSKLIDLIPQVMHEIINE